MMMKLSWRRVIVAFAIAAGLGSAALDACSTFCVHAAGRVLFGRNYDFEIGDGMVVVNTAGLAKRGFEEGGPRWVSRFGSVTFNQFGRDFPMGGMNEAGLVVELMWLDETRYPGTDSRAPLGVLEWIQYQLDTSATVDDVLKSDGGVRIRGEVPIHYLVSDPSGRAATIEFLDGRLVSHTDGELPARVLTNSTYKDSVRFWQSRRGGKPPRGSGSLPRFARAASRIERVGETTPARAIHAAFGILADVAQRTTRWSIVYDQTERVVRFRTSIQPSVREIRLAALSFSCGSPMRALGCQYSGGR